MFTQNLKPAFCNMLASPLSRVRVAQDSVGGVVSCVIYGLPAGLGEPCFDKLEAMLAHAMLSIPASKGYVQLRLPRRTTRL